jgi:hypothetical protein
MGAGERFLDTATRAFAEASGYIEQQRENRRRQQDFESRQRLMDLQAEQTANQIEMQSEARMRERAMDPRFQVQGPSSRIPEAQSYQTPFPEAEAPAGAGVAPEIANALEGITQRFTTGAAGPRVTPTEGPEALIPTGVEGEFYDPTGVQRAAQRQNTYAGEQVRQNLTGLVARYEQVNPELADRMRGQIEAAVASVEAGNMPNQVVQDFVSEVRTYGETANKLAFLKHQLGEDVPEGLDTLSPEEQVEELERIQREMMIRGREVGRETRRAAREDAEPPTRQPGQLSEAQILAGIREELDNIGETLGTATDEQIATARAAVLRAVRPGEGGGGGGGGGGVTDEEEMLDRQRAQVRRYVTRISAAAQKISDEGLRTTIQAQAQAIVERANTADRVALAEMVERLNDISRAIDERTQ